MDILIYIGLAWLVICVVVYFIQERFIFHPEKLPQNFKFQYDRPFTELFFDVERNVRINGLHFAVENPSDKQLHLRLPILHQPQEL